MVGYTTTRGVKYKRSVNSDQTRKPSLEIPKSLCIVANADKKDRTLTVVMGYGTQGLYGYSAGRYCAIGEGFLGRRAGEFEPRVQTTANLFESQGLCRIDDKLDGTTATEMQTMQLHTAEPMLDHRSLPCRAFRQHSVVSLRWHR